MAARLWPFLLTLLLVPFATAQESISMFAECPPSDDSGSCGSDILKESDEDDQVTLAHLRRFKGSGELKAWTANEIVKFMSVRPRAYFSRLFRDGRFRSGMEIGVAGGRFSEHFLIDNANIGPWTWYMMEPFPISDLVARYPAAGDSNHVTDERSWERQHVGANAEIKFIKELSTAPAALAASERTFDFIYLDGAHDYDNVKKEMLLYWPKVKPGGMLAGHDYCHRPPPGKQSLPLSCKGCERIPICDVYTEIHGSAGMPVKDQAGVVRAVQEWLVEAEPKLRLYHTVENFTRASLAADGMDYDLVLTSTRTPSWFVIKPRL